MGAAFSSAVKFEMPRRKNKIPRKCRSRENRGPAAVKRTSSANSVRSVSNHRHKRGLGPTVRHLHEQTHYHNYYNLTTKKPQTYTNKTDATHANKSSKVLIVNPEDKYEDDEVQYIRRRARKSQEIHALDLFTEDFEEIERQLAKYPIEFESKEASRAKMRRFVIAWKTGLSYPHSRFMMISAGIPLTATSYCRQGIGWWKRTRRVCARCSIQATEELMEDLLHRDSLDRFLEETESFKHATIDQFVIMNDLGHKKLKEVEHHHTYSQISMPETHDECHIGDGEDKDDIEIDVFVNIPPPVHIERPPPEQEMTFSDMWLKRRRKSDVNLKERLKKKLHLKRDDSDEKEERHLESTHTPSFETQTETVKKINDPQLD